MSLLRATALRAPVFRTPVRPQIRSASSYATGSPAFKAFWHTRFLLTAATVLGGTFVGGALAVKAILPGTGPIDIGPLHIHGSEEDLISTEKTANMLIAHPVYRALAESPEWTELDDHYHKLAPETRRTKLLAGTLWGHRKMTTNRSFIHKSGKESKNVLALGTALCGHPNVVHGGVLATVFDEALSLIHI